MNRPLGQLGVDEHEGSNSCSETLAVDTCSSCWEYICAIACASACPKCVNTSFGFTAPPMCSDHFLRLRLSGPEVYNPCYNDHVDNLLKDDFRDLYRRAPHKVSWTTPIIKGPGGVWKASNDSDHTSRRRMSSCLVPTEFSCVGRRYWFVRRLRSCELC